MHGDGNVESNRTLLQGRGVALAGCEAGSSSDFRQQSTLVTFVMLTIYNALRVKIHAEQYTNKDGCWLLHNDVWIREYDHMTSIDSIVDYRYTVTFFNV